MAVETKVWIRGIVAACAVAVLGYVLIYPAIEAFLIHAGEPHDTARGLERLSFVEQVLLRAVEALTTFWFLAVGGTVGSYLNVVVYRVPLGISVIAKPSSCPSCNVPIAPRDNIPVLGWLLLGGRCRACSAPIALRYPLVEAATATLFVVLLFVELLSGGANLPVRTPNSYTGIVWVIFYTKWDLVGLYLFHCQLFCTLFAWSLIRFDGERIPWAASLIGFALCAIPPWIWPELMPILFHRGWYAAEAIAPRWLAGGSSVLGGAVGLLLATMSTGINSLARHGRSPSEEIDAGRLRKQTTWDGYFIVGLTLGWQAVVVIGPLHAALRALRTVLSKGTPLLANWPPLGDLLLATVLHHLLWRWLTHGIAHVLKTIL